MSSSDRVRTERMSARIESELEREVDALIHSAQAPKVVFQPIAHLPQLRVVGYEALSRFSAQRPVGPDQWFAAAARARGRTQCTRPREGTVVESHAATSGVPVGEHLPRRVAYRSHTEIARAPAA